MPCTPVFFDCNATIGVPASPVFGNALSVDQLLGELDYARIDAAMVVHTHAQELDYRVGNDLIFEAVQQAPKRLLPMATLFPAPTGRKDRSDAVDYLEQLLAAGFRAVRLHPNPTHHIMDPAVYAPQYRLVPEIVGALLEAMEAYRVPLFVELVQVDWSEVYMICRAYPDLPVVLLNVSYTHKRSLYGGFDTYPNLYCDNSGFHAYRGIEEVCELFGPQRLLFGTRLPLYNALSAVGMVMYADIDSESRAAIAGNNLRRLLDAAIPSTAGQFGINAPVERD